MKKLARRWRRTRGDDEDDDDKLALPTFDDIDSRPIDTQGSSSYYSNYSSRFVNTLFVIQSKKSTSGRSKKLTLSKVVNGRYDHRI